MRMSVRIAVNTGDTAMTANFLTLVCLSKGYERNKRISRLEIVRQRVLEHTVRLDMLPSLPGSTVDGKGVRACFIMVYSRHRQLTARSATGALHAGGPARSRGRRHATMAFARWRAIGMGVVAITRLRHLQSCE